MSNVTVTSAMPRLLRDAGAVEDDVGHLAAAQALGRLLAEDPADRVDDVALARPVRPDDAGDARREVEPGLVGERLEADQFEALCKASAVAPRASESQTVHGTELSRTIARLTSAEH